MKRLSETMISRLHIDENELTFYNIQENPKTPYSCQEDPTLLSVQIEKFNYSLPYKEYFGGVVSMKLNQFLSINGMSNR